MSDGNGRFKAVPAPDGTKGATAAVLLDYDNDGLLDLITASPQGVSVLRGLGSEWEDVTERAVPSAWRPAAPGPPVSSPPASSPPASSTADDPPRLLAAGDLDGDGDEDLVVRFASGRVLVATNDGGNRRPSVSVRLTGRVSNRSGVGSKVELRAGSLRSRTELYATSPAAGPADLIFGLGRRAAPDVVRILWPAGILQAELPESGSEERHLTLDITELDRKPSSCPFLFTWNGDGFEFVTDFLGGAEMGYWAAPGVRNVPDPDEYVRITGEQLRARDGRYELRVTNELEEALFLDQLQLVSVVHAAGTEVYPLEGLTSPVRSGLTVLVSRDARPPLRVTDDRGRDVTLRLAKLDRQFADDLPLLPIRGYASPHALTIDTGAPAETRRVVLLLTGWTDYAFSSDNVAAHQAGYSLAPPSLQVRDARGHWRTVIDQIGIPVGRPQTIVVDLTGMFLSESREVRIVTSMRVYWDRVLVDASGRAEVLTADDLGAGRSASGVRVARVDPMSAALRIRGFSAEVSADGREPFGYDYERVTSTSPWKQMPGRYTKEGDVRDLLVRTDDRFVVSAPGDEIAVQFDANALPPPAPTFDRTFLLFAVGYSKEMDISSASPDQAWPLPFKGMTQYPYAWPEAYPATPEHRDYVQRYNTRVVGRLIPTLESVLLSPSP
jgi:hypothetical protein